MSGKGKEVYVSIDLEGTIFPVGRLWCHNRRGRESATFQYETSWLQHHERFALEPALKLAPGAFHTPTNQSLFGAIGDSAPDRWGRILMRRAKVARAKKSGEASRNFGEVNFLLGVSDEARQGALRFSEEPMGPFLQERSVRAIPPLVELPHLLAASERFLDNEERAEDLRLLLAPGSSLGGARPKASVRDQQGNLAIAKFPRKDDEFDTVIWEAVALELASRAGITVPKWQLIFFCEKPILTLRRFDRLGDQRLPFLSAMSMLGARDNEDHSYLEIVEALQLYGASPNEDLVELWRRIVFSILISNNDDHLRNHGFLYQSQKGWRLSPAYDLNPTPIDVKPRILTLMIDYCNATASIDLALTVCHNFRLKEGQAKEILKEVARAVANWRDVARGLGLQKREIARMETAFEHGDFLKVRAL